jgi:hypothetical protein
MSLTLRARITRPAVIKLSKFEAMNASSGVGGYGYVTVRDLRVTALVTFRPPIAAVAS